MGGGSDGRERKLAMRYEERAGEGAVRGSTEALALKAAPADAMYDASLTRDKDGDGILDASAASGPAPVRTVGDKTFYRDGEKWVDSQYDGKRETTKIAAFSDAYFALLRDHPELGPYVAIGTKLIVVAGDTVYEFTE